MAHVTLDLSKYDALTAYKGLPDEKEENPARFFPDTSSVRRCVRERMSVISTPPNSPGEPGSPSQAPKSSWRPV